MRKLGPVGMLALAAGSALLVISCGVQIHPLEEQPVPPQGSGGSEGNPGTGGSVEPVGSGGTGVPSGSGGTSGAGGSVTVPDGGPRPDLGNPGTGGMPSGMGVMLGATFVPKEKAIAFIHFGHSNMAGRGRAPTTLRSYFLTDVDPRAWMHHMTGSKMGFQPALEPFTAGDSTSLSGMTGGPGTPLVKEAALRAPGYYFISEGFAQNGSYCRNWVPGTTYYEAAMRGPRTLKGKVTFGAIVIMLGITERHGSAQDIQNYPSCINSIVSMIRTELSEPNLPLLLTDYEMTANNSAGEDLRPTGPFGSQIIPRIHTVPTFLSQMHPIRSNPPTGMGAVTKSALVPTEGLSLLDDHHFQLDAHKKWTSDLLDIMKEAGWFPWAP